MHRNKEVRSRFFSDSNKPHIVLGMINNCIASLQKLKFVDEKLWECDTGVSVMLICSHGESASHEKWV